MGSFGGTAFRKVCRLSSKGSSNIPANRPFFSRVLNRHIAPDYDEFPSEWIQGLDLGDRLTRPVYDNATNFYQVKAGQSLEDWEAAGWIRPIDPRGWFQW